MPTHQAKYISPSSPQMRSNELACDNNSSCVSKDDMPSVSSSSSKVEAALAVASNGRKKLYGCKYCDKSFTKPSALRSHEYTHTGEKPFTCHITGCNRRFAVISNLRRHFKVHAPKKSASRLSYQERLRRIQRLEASLSTTLTIPILSSPHPIQPKKEYFAAALSGSSPRSMLSSTTEREGQQQQQQQQQQQSNSINNDNNNNNQQQQHQLLTPPLMPIISVKTPGNMMPPVHTRTTTYQSLASALTPNPLTTTCCDGYPILCTPLSQDIPNQQQFAPQAVPFDMSQPPHHYTLVVRVYLIVFVRYHRPQVGYSLLTMQTMLPR